MNIGTLLLTSSGLCVSSVRKSFLDTAVKLVEQGVAIVTTAAEGKELNKYSQLAKDQSVVAYFW
ncbi:MAG: hypothetical protein Q8Q18_03755 [bacterium]|nr:hypothetical protein [bacterium]